MKEKLSVTGIILAGGKSSRMGQDKAFLPWGSRTVLLEHLTSVLTSLFDETLIITDHRERFEKLSLGKVKVYEDLIKGKGPLGGLYTGLCYSENRASCVLTCDMPFVDEIFLRDLVSFWGEDHDVFCLESPEGKLEPFPGVYARSLRYLTHLLLERGEGAMSRFLEVAVVKPLVLKEEKIRVLTNMNTIEDYYRVLKEKEEWVRE
jgi:molybdopterin-guanine dinucleotide biosynthesis protein A